MPNHSLVTGTPRARAADGVVSMEAGGEPARLPAGHSVFIDGVTYSGRPSGHCRLWITKDGRFQSVGCEVTPDNRPFGERLADAWEERPAVVAAAASGLVLLLIGGITAMLLWRRRRRRSGAASIAHPALVLAVALTLAGVAAGCVRSPRSAPPQSRTASAPSPPAGSTAAEPARSPFSEWLILKHDRKLGRHEGSIALQASATAPVEFTPTAYLVISDSGTNIAFVDAREDKHTYVVTPAGLGEGYDSVDVPRFSEHGAHLVFGAAWDGRRFHVVDRAAQPPYDSTTPIIFAAGTAAFAYAAKSNGKWFVVTESGQGAPFDRIGNLVSSPDGRLAYRAWEAGKAFVVAGDKRGPAFDDVTAGPVFSGDGKRLAYGARKRSKAALVVDGEAGPDFDEVGAAAFSADGRKICYAARTGRKWFVMMDKTKGPPFDGVGSPAFGPRDEACSYSARKGKQTVMMAAGVPGAAFDAVSVPMFVPGTGQLYYAGQTTEGPDPKAKARIRNTAHRTQVHLVIGNMVGPAFDSIELPSFTADGSRAAYAATAGGKEMLVVGDRRYPEFQDVGKPIFSPDGRHVAYVAKRNHSDIVMLDDRVIGEFEVAAAVAFSPDGKTLAFTAAIDREVWRKAVRVAEDEADARPPRQ